jgi:virginiamycin B lyase
MTSYRFLLSRTKEITAGPDGALWATRDSGITTVDTNGQLVKTFALNPGSGVDRITAGPDGNLWFTEITLNKVGYISTDGKLADFQVTDCGIDGSNGITAGSDGAIWFTCSPGPNGSIHRITANGTIDTFQIFNGGGSPQDITTGPDGNLWVADFSYIEQLTPTNPPISTPFLISPAMAVEITSGPDGNLWFIDPASAIGRITTAGVVNRYPVPIIAGGFPSGITTGADGNLWSNLNAPGVGHDRTARITPSGVITIFDNSLGGYRVGITAGPDGDLWVVDQKYGIASVGLDGQIGIPVYPHSGAQYITVGADHKLWFTQYGGSSIGRMSAIHGMGRNLSLMPAANFDGELATFIDGTPTATAADMAATVDWGDGASSAGVVSGPTGGPFAVSGSHVYGTLGNFKTSIKLHESVDNADYVAKGTAAVTTPTSTALTSSANPAAPVDMVTLTATVSTSIGQAGGTVNFLDFGNPIGSATLNNGVAMFTTASLAAGAHAIVAVYVGDAGHNPSSSAELDEIIEAAGATSTSVSVAASGDLNFRGQKIMLTATVSPGAGSAGGTVNFYDGNRLLGSPALDNNGQATISTDRLSTGGHAVRAGYSGDNNFGGSLSPSIIVYRSPRPH